MKKYYILFVLILVSSCGKDSKKEEPINASASIAPYCYDPINNMSGCCSDHGGIKKCNQTDYYFDKDHRPLCNDNTISNDCVGQR